MKVIITAILSFFCYCVHAQTISAKLVDSLSGKPLPYATIIYLHQTRVTYTDSSGIFQLKIDSLPKTDTIIVEYLGYARQFLPLSTLFNNKIIRLALESNILAPVSVQNCRSYKEYIINKRVGKVKEYVGPGPETKFMMIARYRNNKQEEGYVNKIEIWMNYTEGGFKVPVRLHWFEWNDLTGTPGKELTDTNMIVYPHKTDWNSFDIPTGHLYFPLDQIVFGLEFIYPVEQVEKYAQIQGSQEKIDWLQNMNNRWRLGLQAVDNITESAFYIMNNNNISKYNSTAQRRMYRPAIRFTINVCRN